MLKLSPAHCIEWCRWLWIQRTSLVIKNFQRFFGICCNSGDFQLFSTLLKTNYVMEFSRTCTLLSHKDTHFKCQRISGCISHIWPYSAARLGWAKWSSVYGNAFRFHTFTQGKVERDLQRWAIPRPILEQSQHRHLSCQVSVQPAPGMGLHSASSKIWSKASGVSQLNIFFS